MRWIDTDGHPRALPLHPDGPRLQGAYNRRNAYGAAVVFLPEARNQPFIAPMFEAIARGALCGERPLLRELGVDPDSIDGDVTLDYRTRPSTRTIAPQRVQCHEEASHA